MGRVNSLAHYLYKENPSNWSEDVWIERIGQIDFIIETEINIQASAIAKALAAAFGKHQ